MMAFCCQHFTILLEVKKSHGSYTDLMEIKQASHKISKSSILNLEQPKH